ncbi:helix-turn-helix domain-containing protein [Fodinibius sediminis]|nr:AraC family transcriptional regulator [Fodinibius sediminis]
MPEPSRGKSKELLNTHDGGEKYDYSKCMPSEDLQYFIEYYWFMDWNLEGDSYKQEIKSYPSVHLVLEKGNSWIWGVVTSNFRRTIKGEGSAVGIKFRPGGFYPFYESPVSAISDGVLDPGKVFDTDITKLEEDIISPDSRDKAVKRTEHFLREHLPERDERIDRVNNLIEAVKNDERLINVDQLVDRMAISKRSLKKLFKWYVGVSPQWIIKRFRIHEVAKKIADKENPADWIELALGLGYYDQAHFIKDFKTFMGKTPTEYARSIRPGDHRW